MPRWYLAGWKTVTAPNQYDYLLWDAVPIGFGSNGSAELKNNFTLISLSIVNTVLSCVGGILITWTHNGKIQCSLNGKEKQREDPRPNSIRNRIWASLPTGDTFKFMLRTLARWEISIFFTKFSSIVSCTNINPKASDFCHFPIAYFSVLY